jgi:O-antigen/teichoic acid export membrane protein
LALLAASLLYGSAGGGWFMLAFRVVASPVTAVGGAVYNVFTHQVRQEAAGEQQLRVQLVRILLPMSALGVFGGLLLVLLAPVGFPMVFGAAWAPAGLIAAALAPGIAAQFAIAPVFPLFNVLSLQAYQLALEAVRCCAVAAVFLCAFRAGFPLWQAALGYGLVQFGFYATALAILFAALRDGPEPHVESALESPS